MDLGFAGLASDEITMPEFGEDTLVGSLVTTAVRVPRARTTTFVTAEFRRARTVAMRQSPKAPRCRRALWQTLCATWCVCAFAASLFLIPILI